MKEQTFNQSPSQKASNQGGNVTQVGRDYTNTTSTNFFMSFFIIGVLALGGLAWAINVGLFGDSKNNKESDKLSLLQNQKTPNKSIIYVISRKEEN